MTKPMMNFGKRSQISATLSDPVTLMWLVQISRDTNAQMPMKMSMNTLIVAVVPRIQPG